MPIGVTGELYAGGDGVARGYLNDREWHGEHASCLIPFSTLPNAKMYRTGDAARWRPDGTIEFLGRRDRQVKVRGFRIELEEIEHALRECAAIKDVAVITQRDASGTNVLIAYLVPRGPGLDITDVRAWLGERVLTTWCRAPS